MEELVPAQLSARTKYLFLFILLITNTALFSPTRPSEWSALAVARLYPTNKQERKYIKKKHRRRVIV